MVSLNTKQLKAIDSGNLKLFCQIHKNSCKSWRISLINFETNKELFHHRFCSLFSCFSLVVVETINKVAGRGIEMRSGGGDAYTGGFFLTIAIGSVETLKSFPIVLYSVVVLLPLCFFPTEKKKLCFQWMNWWWISPNSRHPLRLCCLSACQLGASRFFLLPICRDNQKCFARFIFPWENKRVREKNWKV